MQGDVVAHWWLYISRLIGSAPDFWDSGPGFESVISHIDPHALQDHCTMCIVQQDATM